jgi:hypothetical protein
MVRSWWLRDRARGLRPRDRRSSRWATLVARSSGLGCQPDKHGYDYFPPVSQWARESIANSGHRYRFQTLIDDMVMLKSSVSTCMILLSMLFVVVWALLLVSSIVIASHHWQGDPLID